MTAEHLLESIKEFRKKRLYLYSIHRVTKEVIYEESISLEYFFDKRMYSLNVAMKHLVQMTNMAISFRKELMPIRFRGRIDYQFSFESQIKTTSEIENTKPA